MFDLYATEGTAQIVRASSAVTAQIMGIDHDNLIWLIEQYGRCDVSDWIAVPSGAPKPDDLRW